MAKKNNTRISRGGGGVLTALSILLLAVIVCGVITHGFSIWTICGCFGHKYGDDNVCVRCGEYKPADETNTASTVLTNGDSKHITLASSQLLNSEYAANGVSQQAESAYTITATVDSEDVDFSQLKWELRFANASSEWATDKTVTDYVKLTVSADTHSATLECLQAFGEQIDLTVTAIYNSEATAKCTIDYVKRITDIKYNHYEGSTQYMMFTTSQDNYNRVEIEPVFSDVGTISPSISDLSFTSLELYIDEGNPISYNLQSYADGIGYECISSAYRTLVFNNAYGASNVLSFLITPDTFFTSTDKTSAKYKQVFNETFNFVNVSRGSAFKLRVGIDVVYGGRLIQSTTMITNRFNIFANKATQYNLANNVSLSDNTIFF